MKKSEWIANRIADCIEACLPVLALILLVAFEVIAQVFLYVWIVSELIKKKKWPRNDKGKRIWFMFIFPGAII